MLATGGVGGGVGEEACIQLERSIFMVRLSDNAVEIIFMEGAAYSDRPMELSRVLDSIIIDRASVPVVVFWLCSHPEFLLPPSPPLPTITTIPLRQQK